METSTTTNSSSSVMAVNNARQLAASALVAFADSNEARLGELTGEITNAVASDVALARSMAAHTTGWTHTTRLREFLESATVRNEVGAHVEAVLP